MRYNERLTVGRKNKATVDYFPHTTEHGKTLFILESKWGNDGYATWFKLLEKLGASDGHYIDCRCPTSITYISAYCRISDKTFIEIIDMLAYLNAIDSDLWRKKIIYCQHFVDNISDAYLRRANNLPTKDKIYTVLNRINDNINPENAQNDDISVKNDDIKKEREKEREREREIKDKPSKQTCAKKNEILLRDAIEENRLRLVEVYPLLDIAGETELLIAKYRDGPVLDAKLLVWTWFKNAKGAIRGTSIAGGTRASLRKTPGIIAPNGPDADWIGGSSFDTACPG